MSEAGIDKLLRSGYLPSLDIADVLALANLPWAEPDSEVAVLRTSAEKAAPAWDTTRKVIGITATQSDDVFEASTNRWWRVEANRIVDLGCYAITVATFCVGILVIDGIAQTDRYETDGGAVNQRIWFNSRLAARTCDLSAGTAGVVLHPAASELPFDAGDMCGHRIATISGGPFAYIPTN